MSDLTITPTRPPTSARRAHVLSEAVVSAYLRDIMPLRQRPVGVSTSVVADASTTASSLRPIPRGGSPRPSPRPRSRGGRRRSALTLGTTAAVQAMRRP